MQPVKEGCREGPGTAARSPTPQPLSPTTPYSPLSPKANTSASAACWGKSLPAELDRSPAALPPPRQHPSLTGSLPLPALPLTLTPSAGAQDFTGMGSRRRPGGGGGGGHAKSGSPKQQSYSWEAGLPGIQGRKNQGIWTPKRSGTGELASGSPREGGTCSESQRIEVGVV